MKRPLLITLFLLTFSLAQGQTNSPPFARFPSISPDGSQVAFSWQGDIWTVSANGGDAARLTIHEAYDARPKWSPDGNHIAFVSDKFGNDDLFVMDIENQNRKRITYHSTDDALTGWTPDNRLIFTTERVFNQVEWEPEIHTVSAQGGTPERFFDAFGLMAAMSPNGRYFVFVRGYNREYRQNYDGPANKDLWVYDTQSDTYQQLTNFKGNDMYPAFAGNNKLFFLSERSDVHNLFSVDFSDEGTFSGDPQQHTSFTEDGIRYFDVTPDGSIAVFERKTGLFRIEVGNEQPSPLAISVPGDARFYDKEPMTFRDDAEEYAVSPNGKYLALVIHGELFIKQNDTEKSRSIQLTDHSYRDRDVAFLNDSTLIFSSDRNGQYDLYALQSASDDETQLFKTLKYNAIQLTDTEEDERNPSVAPNGKKITWQQGRGILIAADIEDDYDLTNKTTLIDGWDAPDDVAWSPDSKWIAYSQPDLDFNHEIYIQPADGSRDRVNVSKHPRPDSDPVWSPDGSKLAFLSSRNNGDDDVWFAWLQKEDWQRTELDWEQSKELKQETKKDSAKTPDVEIDFDNLYKRLQQVTSLPGNESDIAISEDGETFYFVINRDSRQSYDADQDLYQTKWDEGEIKALTNNNAAPYRVRLVPKQNALYLMRRGGNIGRYNLKEDKLESLPFTAKMEVNHPEEQKQIFGEAWRSINHGFYDPDFHGEDWQALREKYEPWAMKASTKRDFGDVINMMLGELNASHMGFYTSDRAETQDIETGLLGIAVNMTDDGAEVTHVVPNSPADRDISKLNVGDVITAVEGNKVSEADNFYSLLNGKADTPTLLTVKNGDGNNQEITIEPTGSIGRELYNEWVDRRKELTDKYSNGRLGYIHVQGMNWPSFERFERELVAAGEGKEGLVIDVRYNGGGWTTDYLLTVLNYRQHAFTIPRGATNNLEANKDQFREHYPFGERLPLSSWTRPSITLANQNSYSNAEIFSHAYKHLNLGTLVGEPTFGAVISTGGVGLMGGSYIRLPYRGWYVKATNKNMEHGPAAPDIEIDNAPDYRAGEDTQLKRAVDELITQIDE
ncbi:MAG: PD40 domain-containing protein [Balneolaceae bacterium]|nr:PD40 domain-containing protein [Balneolaceae bacterium]